MWKSAIICLLVASLYIVGTVGINCYSCTWVLLQSDRTCVDSPTEAKQIPCPTGFDYCSVTRAESDGNVVAVTRNCGTGENREEEIEGGGTLYISSCNEDLCNAATPLTGMISSIIVAVAVTLKQFL